MMQLLATALLFAVATCAFAQTPPHPKPAHSQVPAEDDYKPGPDSEHQPGVPSGKTFQFHLNASTIFPGTIRVITVYVPAEYDAKKPACVYIGLDGLGFAAPVVFDNLIYKKEMPVTIGIGVSPGHVDSVAAPHNPRFNRSFEFDSTDDRLGRFLTTEVLPEVEKQKTPGGLPILLSKNPNDRCVAGGSTGGIGAFTLAWEHPEWFRRVFTAIGTFVDMRGGDRYPALIRKTEPKPIRIFMQDGENDEWMGGPEMGDWWMGNQTVERALEFAGYQVEHVWGHGIHSGRHATSIFPDAMRWIWKDWPQPVTAGQSQNLFLQAILSPGDDWQRPATGYHAPDALAANQQGDVFFRDVTAGKTYRLDKTGKVDGFPAVSGPGNAMAFGPDGRLYVADAADAKILAFDAAGKSAVIATGIRGADLVVTHDGRVYATEPGATDSAPSKVWLIKPDGSKSVVDSGLNHASGIALTPDGLWLCVAEKTTHWGYSYQVEPDGTLKFKQQFYWFHVPDWADDSGTGSLCMDRDGRMYAATRMGVQVMDRNGRVRAILPVPGGEVTSVCFGGANFDTLYATSGDSVHERKLKVTGAPPWLAPITLPNWGAG